MQDYIDKCECHIHSLGGEMRETTILKRTGDNQYLADYNGVKCTAIFNPFAGAYYVDYAERDIMHSKQLHPPHYQ